MQISSDKFAYLGCYFLIQMSAIQSQSQQSFSALLKSFELDEPSF
jgi:hypothetical protein